MKRGSSHVYLASRGRRARKNPESREQKKSALICLLLIVGRGGRICFSYAGVLREAGGVCGPVFRLDRDRRPKKRELELGFFFFFFFFLLSRRPASRLLCNKKKLGKK